MCDNLGAHSVAGIEDCVKAEGHCLIFRPAASPDFAWIESCFSQIKGSLRNSRYFDITPSNLESIIYEEASHICAADVQAFAAHCHYPVSGKEYKPYQTITG